MGTMIPPTRLLRGIVDIDGGLSSDDLVRNYQKLAKTRVDWMQPEDDKIFNFIRRKYFPNRLELPSLQTLLDYFTELKDVETVERLKDLRSEVAHRRGNYAHLVDEAVEDQNKLKAIHLLKQSQEIIDHGMVFGRERKEGLREGISHFTKNVHSLLVYQQDSKIQGDLRDCGQDVWDKYENSKIEKAHGMLCGINNIDMVIRGIRKGELWLHAAYTGQLKTTFALNWAYNQVTRYKHNVFYVTLEVPFEDIMDLIYVMHSSNARLMQKMGVTAPLDFDKVETGTLSEEEEAYYKAVIKDFCENPEYGRFEVWGPDEDVTVDQIRTQAELKNQEEEVHLLVIDHGGLVEPKRKKKDYVIELNSVLRDTKKMALHFNHGAKVPVLLLFQINRDGRDYADKSGGRYQLRALSYANEAERSADVVSTTYLNEDHIRAGTTFFDCLKRRRGGLFPPFTAKIDWRTRRMSNYDQFKGADDKGMTMDDYRSGSDMLDMFSV
jgi:replicative DNA helicase